MASDLRVTGSDDCNLVTVLTTCFRQLEEHHFTAAHGAVVAEELDPHGTGATLGQFAGPGGPVSLVVGLLGWMDLGSDLSIQ